MTIIQFVYCLPVIIEVLYATRLMNWNEKSTVNNSSLEIKKNKR